MIPFNSPYISGFELKHIKEACENGQLSGNGKFSKECQHWFEEKYSFSKCLLTTSCTDALEMSAILIDIEPGDEIIMPAFTFVSTANAFLLRGAKIRFVDSKFNHPNIDESYIEELINEKTKAIVVVHYAGFACNMHVIQSIARKYELYLIEDAAQALDNFFIDELGNRKPLGSFGDLATFSFHETKNVHCGEGGLLVVNNSKFFERAEIIWEKGTNRSSFFRGERNKYGWVDIGSSFLPSELNAAFLWGQLQNIDFIQASRLKIWKEYYFSLEDWASSNRIELPVIPNYSTNNAHMFYLIMPSLSDRTRLIDHLRNNDVQAVFHYQSLNKSDYYLSNNSQVENLINSDLYSDRLVRLPLYIGVDQQTVIEALLSFSV